MIFVTVGTQFFDELIEEVDRLVSIGVLDRPVLAQIGLAKYSPVNIDAFAFDRNLMETARQADLIITHAGTGSLCEFIALGRPFIAVVNGFKAGNHQLEFLEHLSSLYDFCWITQPGDLEKALPHARPATPLGESGRALLTADIRGFVMSAVNRGRPSPPAQAYEVLSPTK